MTKSARRRTTLFSVSTLVGLLAATAPALAAAPTQTKVTAPADPLFYQVDDANPDTASAIDITGTSNGDSGLVDIVCLTGDGYETTLDDNVPVGADGAFSGSGEIADVDNDSSACRIRAVPDGGTPDDLSNFDGPRVFPVFFDGPASQIGVPVHGGGAVKVDTYTNFALPRSAGNLYDIDDDPLYNFGGSTPQSLYSSVDTNYYSMDSGMDLPESNLEGDGTSIKVDGHNAWTNNTLRQLDYDGGGPEGSTLPTGVESLEVTSSLSAAGVLTQEQKYHLYLCDEPDVYPTTATSCDTVTKSGVQLVRKWTTRGDGATIHVSDRFVSTDGLAHAINLEYSNEAEDQDYAEWLLPGASTWDFFDDFFVTAVPAGPGNLFHRDTDYRDSPYVSQGAITYYGAPTRSKWDGDTDQYFDYAAQVPAGGEVVIDHAFTTGFSTAGVAKEAGGLIDELGGPAIAITSPVEGAATTSPQALIQGTASDNAGTPSVKVNGITVPVNPDGTWSFRTDLVLGPNTVTATATDGAGLTAQATRTVTHVVPATRLCVVPKVKRGSKKGAARKALKAADCGSKVKKKRSKKVKKGRVIKLNRPEGMLLVADTKVTVVVSKGKRRR